MVIARLTAVRPASIDPIAAAVAGTITSLLLVLRLSGVTPDLDIPPDVVLGFVTAIITVAAALRSRTETVSRENAAKVVSDLVAELVARKTPVTPIDTSSAVTVVEPVFLPPLHPEGPPQRRQGG